MSSIIRRSFNLLKYIDHNKPITKLVAHPTAHKSIIAYRLPLIHCIRSQYLSSNPPENRVFSDDFNDSHSRDSSETTDSDLTETTMNSMTIEAKQQMNVANEPNVDQIRQFWARHDISVHGRDAPMPVLDMSAYDWPDKVKESLDADRFTEPTPIQSQAWPIVLSGRDMVGVAQTGSGKTLCYVLPAFVRIANEGLKRGPKCLILAPTRELAQQIQAVVRRYRFANNVCLYGGASRQPQMQVIREHNPQIIVATPGRMIDFVESGVVDLQTIDYLVLDEADRMLDMGFEPQIRKIIERTPEERQTVMWSATWPKEVKELAAQYMRDYIQINVGGTELTANKNIQQIVEVCEEFDKKRKLFELLTAIRADLRQNKTLIFAKTKQSVDYLTNEMQANGWSAVSIHGDKTQMVRDRVLGDFRNGRFSILVATDVAARGLDVDDIKFVINFDYPNSGEDYVHRIGRTGRLDRKGTAYTLFSSQDARQANELIEVLRESNQTVNPELLAMADMSRGAANANRRRRYGTVGGGGGGYGGYGGYGYQQNNSYGRNYGQQQQQRRRPSAYQSGYGSNYGSDESYGYKSNFDSNSGTKYNGYSNSGSSRGSGPPFRGY